MNAAGGKEWIKRCPCSSSPSSLVFCVALSSGMLCPNFTFHDSLLLLVQPSSLLSLSSSLPCKHSVSGTNCKHPKFLARPLSPFIAPRMHTRSIWVTPSLPNIFDPWPPVLLLFSNPLPQLKPTLNSFKSAPSLPNPTSNVPSPCISPQLPLSFHSSSSFLCSFDPSPTSPSPQSSLYPHLVLSIQVSLVRFAVGVSSSTVAGRWLWRLRLWKPATQSARGGTSWPRPRSWVSLTTRTWSGWMASWRGAAPSSSSQSSWRTERSIPSSGWVWREVRAAVPLTEKITFCSYQSWEEHTHTDSRSRHLWVIGLFYSPWNTPRHSAAEW